jgi:adenylate cyclase
MEEKVKAWIVQKDKLAAAKIAEGELRAEICEHILAGKIKGAKKGIIGVYVLIATAKLGQKIDKDALKSIWTDLSKAERQAIRFKPELIAKEYKMLGAKSILHQTITSKPGTPGLELKAIKEA